MGSGSFDTKKYSQNAVAYQKQERASLFQQSRIASHFNPLEVKTRESCASTEHPDPTSIIIACDVTGSMGKIPEDLLKGGLGKIMGSLLQIQAISNPQVMFAAVGDTDYDTAPLQVTQFESDNRIEAQLKDLYLEGGGGGNNHESYHAIWYFAAYKTQLDAWKTGKKGLLFTMGDEMVPSVLKGDHIRKFIDKSYAGMDISTSELFSAVSAKYDVFHLLVQDTETYKKIGAANVNACWQQYLGERAILVPHHTDIPEKIISTVQTLCELHVRADKDKPVPVIIAADPGLDSVMSQSVFSAASPNASAVLNKSSDNVPHLFICPISQEVMKAPVVAEDGYTYERESITAWLQKKATSPMTNAIMGKLLISNHSLKSEIEQWQAKRGTEDLSSSHTTAVQFS